MAYYSDNWTDKELEALERRIAEVYKQAERDLDKEVKEYFAKFKLRDKEMQALVNAGKMTKADYQQWRLTQIGRGQRFEALRDKVAERYTEANEVANAYVNDLTPSIYSLNRNYEAYTIEKAVGSCDFTLWDEATVRRLLIEQPDIMPYYPKARALKRGIDLDYGKSQITKHVTSGIIRGLAPGKIANELMTSITAMNRDSAVRAARTGITAAQNAGRMDSYIAAEKMGVKIKRRWICTKDSRTRLDHGLADGQIVVGTKTPFIVGGYKMMFPGDKSLNAPGHEIYNCRCTTRTVEKDGIEAEPREMRVKNPETGKWELVNEMTYSEWQEWKKTGKKPEPPKSKENQYSISTRQKAAQRQQANSIQEAIAIAESKGVKYSRFDKMDLGQVNNVLNAIDTLPADCRPVMIANGKDISTATGRPLGRKADQWWGVTYDYRDFSLRTMQLGYDSTDFDGGQLVGLNTTKFKTLEALTKAKQANNEKYFAKTGRYWSFNVDGKATAYHEFGHCFVNERGLPQGWESLSKKWAEESKCDILKNPDEAFAEAWAAFGLGDERLPSYISDAIVKEMEKK